MLESYRLYTFSHLCDFRSSLAKYAEGFQAVRILALLQGWLATKNKI